MFKHPICRTERTTFAAYTRPLLFLAAAVCAIAPAKAQNNCSSICTTEAEQCEENAQTTYNKCTATAQQNYQQCLQIAQANYASCLEECSLLTCGQQCQEACEASCYEEYQGAQQGRSLQQGGSDEACAQAQESQDQGCLAAEASCNAHCQ